jgi:mono/diheme cytochrome c family protein
VVSPFASYKTALVLGAVVLLLACASRLHRQQAALYSAKPVAIPPNPQRPGNADTGYAYLVNGNYLKSGIPASLAKKFGFTDTSNLLRRSGDNAALPYDYTTIYAPNGVKVVAPNCLYCHAQKWGDSVVVGMGNSLSDYSMPTEGSLLLANAFFNATASREEKAAAANLLRAGKATAPFLVTASKGVNIADRLTAVLAAHRNPASFVWQPKPQLSIPQQVVPTDVPAWWLLKKKHAMFYSGFGRGNFARFLMAANLLTVTDTAEAAEVLTHFNDVLAYLYSLKPPRYPHAINQQLAAQGEAIFNNNCSKCHGTYGANGSYPNLLVPTHIVQTDSTLVQSNFSSPQFLDWFRKSWFAMGPEPAALVPFNGYIAPPLDGVWCTAPYLHNASVPNLETLLNSAARPKFWARNFEKPNYDYQQLGWHYTQSDRQYTRSTYNTTLPGYGNGGHRFGDKLTPAERKAVIEYLKTL